jgi:integrase
MATAAPKIRLPKLDRHVGSGQARVRIAGKTYYCGKYGSPESEEKYRRLISEYVSTGKPPVRQTEVESLTINEAIAKFRREHVEVAYRKNGEITSEVSLFQSALMIVSDLFGSESVDDFTPKCLRTCRDVMIRTPEKGGKGWTRQSANAQTRRIKQAWKWFVEHEVASPITWQALSAVSGLKKGRTAAPENRTIKPVDWSALKASLRHLTPVVRDMVRLQLRTGMRPGEICSIRPCDVDTAGDVWTYRPESHKTDHHGKSRTIFLGPIEILHDAKRSLEHRLFAGGLPILHVSD